MNIYSQMENANRLISERLSNILKGDFSWVLAFIENNKTITKKVEYMTNHWAVDNPVRIKFMNGNPDWEKEFDSYKTFLEKLQKK